MPDSELIAGFRSTLKACESLYRESGQLCARNHPHLIRQDPEEFVDLMLDLHRGLVVKLFVNMASADHQWTSDEWELAAVLVEHVWSHRLQGENLQRAIGHAKQQSVKLAWFSLFRPFDDLAPLRGKIAELETVVTRLANLVAKADGQVHRSEVEQLHVIQTELDSCLKRLPLDMPGQHEAANQRGTEAVKQLEGEAQQLRKDYNLPSQKKERSKHATEPGLSAAQREQMLASAMAELESLIGLGSIKQEVQQLVNFLKVQKSRAEHGLPNTPLSLHMIFDGNPGTGKTTVARLIGQIYGGLGILERGHLIETDRGGLVAGYAGQTATKTQERVDEATGGVLFIDEAYSLVSESNEDAFGAEALQTLLKCMEDRRDQLIVILAGYPEPMTRLLKSNPGLSSRFSRRLEFADYGVTELAEIFHAMCCKSQYEIPASTRARLLWGFDFLLMQRDEHFGNGRLVRNVFEKATCLLANRIANIAPLTRELLTTFEPVDIQMRGVPDEVWEQADGDCRFKIACPECAQENRIATEWLTRGLRCKCGARFRADWASPDRPGKP